MVWTYMGPPIQWIYDYFLIESYFNVYQLISFLILCIVYYLKISDVYSESKQMSSTTGHSEKKEDKDEAMEQEEMWLLILKSL